MAYHFAGQRGTNSRAGVHSLKGYAVSSLPRPRNSRLLFGLGLIALASCSLAADKTLGTEATDRFHTLYKAENYAAIYGSADNALQKATPDTEFVALMSAIHRKLGLYQSSTPAGWRASQTMAGSEIALAFHSQFAAGAAQEEFVYRVSSGKASLIRYNVNSPLLILK
jgi:hypothetical protein